MRSKGFTLVELLAVIVILAIILAIAIPGITGIVESARKKAFEDSVRLIIRGIDTKQASNGNYDITDLNTDSLESDLHISNDNYEYVGASLSGSKVYIDVIGKSKWEGLEAHGFLTDLVIMETAEATVASDSCFTFNTSTGTITNYDFDNPVCPDNLIIPNNIDGVNVTHIGPGAFVNPTEQYCHKENPSDEEDPEEYKDISYVLTEGDGYSECHFYWEENGTLTGLTIPNTVISIGYETFSSNDIVSLSLGNGITHIGNNAFAYNKLSSLFIPSSMRVIEENAFMSNQISTLNIANGIENLSGFAENYLSDVSIPSSVTSIGNSAFAYNQLTNVTIPDDVVTIGEMAFENNQITSVILPDGLTTIKSGAFWSNGISTISLPDTLTHLSGFEHNQISSVSIPNNVTYLGGFLNNPLTSLTIPNGVITIEADAFRSVHLDEVTIPDTVTFIGDAAFYGSNLNSVDISNAVTYIGDYAFASNQLTSIDLPDTLTSIGEMAFSRNGLTSLSIPSSVTSLEGGAFNNNMLPPNQAFIYDRNATGTVNNAILKSYGGALRYAVSIPDTVTTIAEYALSENGLSSVIIPDSVTSIEEYAFYSNYLGTITIPSSVTSIARYALHGNYLTSIIINATEVTIGDSLFGNNDYFREAYTAGGAGTYYGTERGTWTKQ